MCPRWWSIADFIALPLTIISCAALLPWFCHQGSFFVLSGGIYGPFLWRTTSIDVVNESDCNRTLAAHIAALYRLVSVIFWFVRQRFVFPCRLCLIFPIRFNSMARKCRTVNDVLVAVPISSQRWVGWPFYNFLAFTLCVAYRFFFFSFPPVFFLFIYLSLRTTRK